MGGEYEAARPPAWGRLGPRAHGESWAPEGVGESGLWGPGRREERSGRGGGGVGPSNA